MPVPVTGFSESLSMLMVCSYGERPKAFVHGVGFFLLCWPKALAVFQDEGILSNFPCLPSCLTVSYIAQRGHMVYPRSHSSLSFYYTSLVTQNAVWINSQKAEGNIFADSLQMCLLTHPNSQRLLSLHVTFWKTHGQTLT